MKKTIEIHPTPSELAEVFIHWGDDKQSEFIDMIGRHFKDADFSAETQCCFLADRIGRDGQDFIYTLANYLKARGLSNSPKFSEKINMYPNDGLF